MAIKAVGWLEEKIFNQESGGVESRSEMLPLAHVTYRRIFDYNGRIGLVDQGIKVKYFLDRNIYVTDAKPEELPEIDVRDLLNGRYPPVYIFVFLLIKQKDENLPYGLTLLTGEEAGKVDNYLDPVLKRREVDRYPEWGLAVRVDYSYQSGDLFHQKMPTPDQMSETTFEELLRLGPIGQMGLPDDFLPIYTEACIEFLHREVVMQVHPTANIKESEAIRRVREMIQQTEIGRHIMGELRKGEPDDNFIPIPRIIKDGKVTPDWDTSGVRMKRWKHNG